MPKLLENYGKNVKRKNENFLKWDNEENVNAANTTISITLVTDHFE